MVWVSSLRRRPWKGSAIAQSRCFRRHQAESTSAPGSSMERRNSAAERLRASLARSGALRVVAAGATLGTEQFPALPGVALTQPRGSLKLNERICARVCQICFPSRAKAGMVVPAIPFPTIWNKPSSEEARRNWPLVKSGVPSSFSIEAVAGCALRLVDLRSGGAVIVGGERVGNADGAFFLRGQGSRRTLANRIGGSRFQRIMVEKPTPIVSHSKRTGYCTTPRTMPSSMAMTVLQSFLPLFALAATRFRASRISLPPTLDASAFLYINHRDIVAHDEHVGTGDGVLFHGSLQTERGGYQSNNCERTMREGCISCCVSPRCDVFGKPARGLLEWIGARGCGMLR